MFVCLAFIWKLVKLVIVVVFICLCLFSCFLVLFGLVCLFDLTIGKVGGKGSYYFVIESPRLSLLKKKEKKSV